MFGTKQVYTLATIFTRAKSGNVVTNGISTTGALLTAIQTIFTNLNMRN